MIKLFEKLILPKRLRIEDYRSIFHGLLQEMIEQGYGNFGVNDLHQFFFDNANEAGLNTGSGIVRTPKYIADYMVSQSVNLINKDIKHISWLDPCCGSGVFPESILDYYFLNQQSKTISNLPRITIVDNSNLGVLCCLLTIYRILEKRGLSIEDYIKSKRLNIMCIDALHLYKEKSEIFDSLQDDKFDVVIGNPPYVRSLRLSKEYKSYLKSSYPSTYSGNADLYFFFISLALNALKNNGILTYISPANFFRSSAALRLRSYIENLKVSVKKVVDLDELPVFAEADIHTAIYQLAKGSKANDVFFDYASLKVKDDLKKLSKNTLQDQKVPNKYINKDGWIFKTANKNSFDIASIDETNCLEEVGFSIYSGIRPGLKKAFLYDKNQIAKLKLSRKLIEQWFIPCAEGRDLTKWKFSNNNKFLLLIKHHSHQPPQEIIELIEPFKNDLAKRHECQKGIKWYQLRPCSYYGIFDQPKIVFPDISSSLKYSLDIDKNIILDGAYAIDTSNLSLLGILNSDYAWQYFIDHCSSIGNAKNKGRLRLKKNHVTKFPLPKIFTNQQTSFKKLESLVKKVIQNGESKDLINDINKEVKNIYLKKQ